MRWWDHIDIALLHSFPLEVILQVPLCIYNSIIRLNVCEKSSVVKHAVHSPVESMNSGIVLV